MQHTEGCVSGGICDGAESRPIYYSESQKELMRERWRAGESLQLVAQQRTGKRLPICIVCSPSRRGNRRLAVCQVKKQLSSRADRSADTGLAGHFRPARPKHPLPLNG
ncbi:hypothetical protein BURKHO8Y_580082 [Burkholderia sp. 8Y]|nr:hypothetical protein BURKHO8Y_580082 [Burkholderia sp. 8Y]